MGVNPLISIVIPNYNGASTIGKCLESVYRRPPTGFEVIVVDDGSDDGSIEIIKKFPCRLEVLPEHSGASAARNEGARQASGEAIFFMDSDCMLTEDTLETVVRVFKSNPGAVTGGTYTPLPYDKDFFSVFQSVSINYAETKPTKRSGPDYAATHAMVIGRELFLKNGGFREDFLPILEDVEFSHRLTRAGVRLLMNPDLLVKHIFNFTLRKSMKNAFRKSMYWTAYSMRNRDLFSNSGAASHELKSNVLSVFLCLLLLLAGVPMLIPVIFGVNIYVNRKLFEAMREAGGIPFLIKAIIYYTSLYAFAVGAGALWGAMGLLKRGSFRMVRAGEISKGR